MDSLELIMAQGDANEIRNLNGIIVPELLQITHKVGNSGLMGRDIRSIIEIGASNAGPVYFVTGQNPYHPKNYWLNPNPDYPFFVSLRFWCL